MTKRTAILSLVLSAMAAVVMADGMLTASCFSSLYKTATEAIACDVQGTYYEVPTWIVGTERNADGQTDGDIAITQAGTYWISSSTSFDGVSAHEYDWCLHINGVEMHGMEAENTAQPTGGLSVAACSVATYCAVGYVLDMRVADNSGTGTVNLHKCMLSVNRIGP